MVKLLTTKSRKLKSNLSVFFVLVFIFSIILPNATAFANTEGEEKVVLNEIKVLDNKSATLKSYFIEPDNSLVNAGSIISKAIRFAKDLATAKNPITIDVPKGNYFFSSMIYCFSNVNLSFNNSYFTANDDLSSNMIRFGRSTTNAPENNTTGYDGFVNITIKNATFDQNFVNSSCIGRFAHAKNILFESITFKNNQDSHHVETAAISDFKFNKCKFIGQKGTSSTAGANTKEAIQLDILSNNGHFGGFAEYDGTQSKNVTISNCRFENVYRGIGTPSKYGSTYFDNITIKNNIFQSLYLDSSYYNRYTGEAIFITGYKNSRITGNIIDSPLFAIVLNDVKDSKINKNKIVASKSSAISAIKLNGSKNNIFESNTIEKYKTSFYLYKSESNKINFNTINNPSSQALFLSESGRKNKISQNTISKAKVGIEVSTNSGGYFEDNKLYSSGTAIKLGGIAGIVRDNYIDESTQNGIEISSGSPKVLSNRVTQSKSQGIIIKGGTPILERNRVSSNLKSGIYITGGNPTLNSNRIANNKRYGIYISPKRYATISYNEFEKNTKGAGVIKRKNSLYSFTEIPIVTQFNAKSLNKSALLNWTALENISSYEIYKGNEKKENFVLDSSHKRKTTQFQVKKLKNNTTYSFKMQALKKVDNVILKSKYSKTRLVTPTKNA